MHDTISVYVIDDRGELLIFDARKNERMPGDKKKAILYVVNDDGLEKCKR